MCIVGTTQKQDNELSKCTFFERRNSKRKNTQQVQYNSSITNDKVNIDAIINKSYSMFEPPKK
jgi:hypothetical protein